MKIKTIIFTVLAILGCAPGFLNHSPYVRKESKCQNECVNSPRTQICIKRVIDEGSQNILKIYENEIKHNNFEGKLKVKFLILQNGTVEIKEIMNNTIKDSIFVANLVSEIKLWQFCSDTSAKPVEVVFPFVFENAK
jgi:hypothetical protein